MLNLASHLPSARLRMVPPPFAFRFVSFAKISPVTAVTTVTAYCALKNIVTAVTVITRSTVLCRFQQSKNVSICISKYGIW